MVDQTGDVLAGALSWFGVERLLRPIEELRRAYPEVRFDLIDTSVTNTIGSYHSAMLGLLEGAALAVLDQLGVNVAPLIASAGVVGVAIGFGAQSLVKDYLSGIFMIFEDQYGVGDVIDTGEAIGTVEEVTLRITRLRDVARIELGGQSYATSARLNGTPAVGLGIQPSPGGTTSPCAFSAILGP